MGGLACKEKIIQDGGNIGSTLEYLCARVKDPSIIIADDAGYKMIELLNHAEDTVNSAVRVYLQSQGFNGPWPRALSQPGDKSPA